MDGMTVKNKCERLESCGVMNDWTTQLQTACKWLKSAYCACLVRRAHVIFHNDLTVVKGVLVIAHTFTLPFVTVICS